MAVNGEAAVRRSIVQSFKLQGLTLQSQATSALVELLEPYRDSEDLDQILDRIVEAVQKQPLTTSLVKKDVRRAPAHLYMCTFTSYTDTEHTP